MRQVAPALLLALVSAGPAAPPATQTTTDRSAKGLTSVEGLKVGHYTMPGRPTGCTVVIAERGAVASVDVRGGAPATRETDLLRPENLVQQVHAIVLSGGSAYGLDSAGGVMKYLEERKIGYQTTAAVVPIVPGASLIDLAFGGDPAVRPDAACGYRAAQAASPDAVREGNVGAGAGATVGKLFGMSRAMKAGIGSASIELPDGLVVAALVAVNAFGDVIDPDTGAVVAGVRTADGRGLADARRLIRSGALSVPRAEQRNHTTIGIVATNATLTKAQAFKVAQMAHDGYARAIAPTHTPYDGDTIFAVATAVWSKEPDLAVVGALAADAVAQAVVRAARRADALGGLPSAKDITR
jgi:L-aminopeptidase/D-esterase-like protein